MFSTAGVLDLWSNYLRKKFSIPNDQIVNCDDCVAKPPIFAGGLSVDKDKLFLKFIANENPFVLEIQFLEGNLMILTSENQLDVSDSQKGIVQFKEIENQAITRIVNDPKDRWICMELTHGLQLWIKGFGKMGNVILRDTTNNSVKQMFRLSQKSDWGFVFPSLNPSQWYTRSLKPLDNKPKVSESLSSGPMIEVNTILPDTVLNQRNKQFSIEVLCHEQRAFIRQYYFKRNKDQMIAVLEKKIKLLSKILSETNHRMQEIATRRSNKELGDILLTHAHSLRPGLSKALVTDYFTQQRIWIKLNATLSAVENANKYYGKAKNERIESQKIQEKYHITLAQITDFQYQLETVKNATDLKAIKTIQKIVKPLGLKSQEPLPYKLYECMGYQIWLGKNNKSNDQMLKLSQKNDLWLHAKDVSGSHVIIKKKGVDYPKAVVNFAAQLAAKNSKAKNQAIVPVIVVLRKYVSKPKQAALGEVRILKEDCIDAFLDIVY